MNPRGLLFAGLALGLLAIGAFGAVSAQWVIAVAGLVLGLWMADLARREVRRR